MWRTKRREEGGGRLALAAAAVERGERGLQAERALERTPAVDVFLQIALSEFCAIYPSFDTSCHLKRSRNATSLALLGHAKQASQEEGSEGAAGGANARLLRSEGASHTAVRHAARCAAALSQLSLPMHVRRRRRSPFRVQAYRSPAVS